MKSIEGRALAIGTTLVLVSVEHALEAAGLATPGIVASR
jgi:hypothetical protein